MSVLGKEISSVGGSGRDCGDDDGDEDDDENGKRFGATGGNKGCYFCFTQPLTVESSAESQTSDPNSPNFTYGKLRSFIEMNDFYSKECNHHVNYDPT
ncbi:hypothetical protein M0R45_028684 [Rubus argutus]|uniref:Uncharacterized protein n=1 Tax=Rubus argutus TaxID=59490 RepID=A0AAW1W6B6_RUBAR